MDMESCLLLILKNSCDFIFAENILVRNCRLCVGVEGKKRNHFVFMWLFFLVPPLCTVSLLPLCWIGLTAPNFGPHVTLVRFLCFVSRAEFACLMCMPVILWGAIVPGWQCGTLCFRLKYLTTYRILYRIQKETHRFPLWSVVAFHTHQISFQTLILLF